LSSFTVLFFRCFISDTTGGAATCLRTRKVDQHVSMQMMLGEKMEMAKKINTKINAIE
jgi:hypothetical protein